MRTGRSGWSRRAPARDAAAGPTQMWIIPDAGHGVGDGVPETMGLDDYGQKIEDYLRELAPACLGL